MKNEEVAASEEIGIAFVLIQDLSRTKSLNQRKKKKTLNQSKFALQTENDDEEEDMEDEESEESASEKTSNNSEQDEELGDLEQLRKASQ